MSEPEHVPLGRLAAEEGPVTNAADHYRELLRYSQAIQSHRTRYDKLALNFIAGIGLAACVVWLN